MSSSRRRDTRDVGVGTVEERVSRTFPPALIKSRRSFGVRFGPSPIQCQKHVSPPSPCKNIPFDLDGSTNR